MLAGKLLCPCSRGPVAKTITGVVTRSDSTSLILKVPAHISFPVEWADHMKIVF